MKRWIQRGMAALGMAWASCVTTLAAGLIPVLIIFYVQGRSIAHHGASAVSWIEAACYDLPFRFRRAAATEDAVIVLITTNELDHLDADRDSRIDREHMATALGRIADQEPRLVLLDVLFSDAMGDAADLALAEQLRRLSNVLVLATSVGGPSEEPNPLFATPGIVLGSANVDRRPWNTVRLLPGIFMQGRAETSAARVAAERLGWRMEQHRPPVGGCWLNYLGPGARPGVPGAFRTLDFSVCANTNAPFPTVSRHPMVFLGDARRDVFRNPVDGGDISGVELHATAVLNLRENNWLRLAPVPAQLALILVWGLALPAVLEVRRTAGVRLGVIGAAAGMGVGSIILALVGGVWWWWLIPVAAQTSVALLFSAFPGRPMFFISYRDSDGRREALWLEGALRAVGRRAYLAPGNIESGEEIWPELDRHIRRARVLLLVLTPAGVADLATPAPVLSGGAKTVAGDGDAAPGMPWVTREVQRALGLRRRILVLRVGTAPLKREMLRREVAEVADRLSIEYGIANRDEVLRAVVRALYSGRPARV